MTHAFHQGGIASGQTSWKQFWFPGDVLFMATCVHPDPTIAVPVVLLGIRRAEEFGFSTTCTHVAMVRPSVCWWTMHRVVENVERIMSEEGLPPWRPRASPWTRLQRVDRHRVGALSAVFGPDVFRRSTGSSTSILHNITPPCCSRCGGLVLTPVLCQRF